MPGSSVNVAAVVALVGLFGAAGVAAYIVVRTGLLRGDRLGARVTRPEFDGLPALGWGLGGLALLFAVAASASVAATWAGPAKGEGAAAQLAQRGVVTLLSYGLSVPLALATWWMAKHASGRAALAAARVVGGGAVPRARTPMPAWRAAWWGCVGAVLLAPMLGALSVVAAQVAAWVRGAPTNPVAHDTLKVIIDQRDNPWVWALMLGAAVGAPIVEEVLYRGFVQTAIVRATAGVRGGAWLGVLVTSLGFALTHAGGSANVPWHALVVLFGLSVGLGVAFERTGRLIAPIVVHAAFNAGNLALALSQGG